MRRYFFLLLVCLLCFSGCKKHDRIEKVILISIDDLRADFLGAYNNKMNTSPVIDRLAAENILCTNVTSQASTTVISHKSILFSLYPSVHQTSVHVVPEVRLKNPVEILRENGFKTAAIVGGVQVSRHFGFDKGFETFQVHLKTHDPIEELKRQVGEWLDKNYDNKFFLFLHTYAVHCPFDPPKQYLEKYAAWYQGDLNRRNACGGNYYNKRTLTADDYRYLRDLYAAEVNYMDTFMDALLSKLKSLGIYDQTMIVFLSDHGESLGERDYIGHNQLYQIQLHIPLIIRIPGQRPHRIDAPLESIDVMPTIFAVTGVNSNYPFEGENLLPSIQDRAKSPSDRIRISENVGQIQVRKNNWACIIDRSGKLQDELYNVEKDPLELTNLAPENPDIVKEFKKAYLQMSQNNRNTARLFVVTSKNPRMSEEDKEQMRALGYVDN